MNIEEYILSGIVESYVLGLAEPAEREEFEQMCLKYPEVLAARQDFENSIEEFSTMNASRLPENLKSKIFSAIDLGESEEPPRADTGIQGETAVVPFPTARVRSMGWQRYLAAASIVLLLISTGLNFYFFNKYREYDKRYEALVISQSELASHNQVLQTRLLDYEKAVDWMKDPDMAVVKMSAVPNGPSETSATTVYWNKITKNVYLAISQLPPPDATKQYQLWAMVDGVPVDAGVFDLGDGAGVIKMKTIPRAQAFAITLEKKGGSAKPTMTQLYVLGKV